jgi:16S rRNA (adenine1518-N6/adenine1519-N6)-dimethyltransferase
MNSDLPPINIPELLRRYGLHPDKRLGQNYLIDPAALNKVIAVAELQPEDHVLEIGAGPGNLTRYLAAHVHRVVAVEVDGRILEALGEVTRQFDNIEVIHADILTVDPAILFPPEDNPGGYLVVANIPYYITSAVIRHLLEAPLQPRRLILTVQQEVAERICAAPGDLSLLALSIQVYGLPTLAASIPAGAFFPPPQVDSAVVRIDLYPQPRISSAHLDLFFRLIKAGFSQKRKTLRNSLAGGLSMPNLQVETMLERAAIDPRRRAETLALEEWQRLCEIFASNCLP